MDFELWLTVIVAYTVIFIIPGPSVFMVTSQALTRGSRAAFCASSAMFWPESFWLRCLYSELAQFWQPRLHFSC